jgi:hypothetical protein
MYGEPLTIVLWIYNPSEEPLWVTDCGDIDFFWDREIEVLDSAGNRVLSRREDAELADKRRDPNALGTPFRCWLNFRIAVPPHACLHGSFSKPDNDFTRNLNHYYMLPAGQYSLSPAKKNGTRKAPANGAGDAQRVALEITVTKP